MIKRVLGLLCSSLLCFSIVSKAQNNTLHAIQFSMRNGLSHNTINDIVEDSYGYIWIATPNGLNRYDGYSIKQYFHSLNDSTSVADNYINGLYCNKKGELLVFCRNGGITRYDYRSDKFTTSLVTKKTDIERLRKNNIHKMIEDSFGYQWIATDFSIARCTKQSWHWYARIAPDIELSTQSVRLLGLNIKNQIIISPSLSGGVYYYESANDSFFPLKESLQFSTSKPVATVSFLIDKSSSTQWFATMYDGLYLSNLEDNVQKYSGAATEASHRVPSNSTLSLFNDYQGVTWLGMRNAGLAYFDKKEQRFFSCSIECGDKVVQQYSVKTICSDAVHNMWVGTEEFGAFCVGYRSNQFRVFSSFALDLGISSNSNVSCLYEYTDKSLWLGTYGDDLLRFDIEKSMAERFTIPSTGMIVDICSNGDGRFWIATWGGGVYLFDPVRGSVLNGPERAALKAFTNCKAVLKVKNNLWIATHGQGIVIYDCLTNQVYDASRPSPQLRFEMNKPRWASDLALSKNGSVWIAANSGVFEFDGIKLIEHSVEQGAKRRIDNMVSTVFVDSKDDVWLGGVEGLDRFDTHRRRFVHLHNKYKNLPEKIKAISEDKNGCLWLTGESEVVSFSPQTGSVRVFDAAEGMSLQQFNDRAIFRTSTDWMVVGSSTGMALFRPENVAANHVVPRVVIQSCYILDTANGVIQGGLLPTKDILMDQKCDTLTLSYSDSRFVGFNFVGINLLSSSKIQYAYQMDGFDAYWHYAGVERKASYTNLPPGFYRFRVKAANSDGFWNEKGTSLVIEIMSPWWQRWWFIVLVIICFIGFIAIIISVRTAQIRKTNKRLEEQVKQRTQQLHEKSLFIEAQNNDLLYKNARIEEQNHELSVISDQLQHNNVELQYKNEDLESMTEELRVQSEALLSTNETLTQTIATKDKLFSVIAHDLKNPFSGIISFIDLLQTDYEQFDDEKRQYFISMIAKSSQTVFGLLTNLFNWARSQTGIMDAKPESFIVDELFELVKEQQQHLAEAKSISIDIETDRAIVYADRSMIETVVRNLVHNAIKFTRPGGVVRLRAQTEDKQVMLCVADSGVGISTERMNHIFSPNQFQSSHGTDSEKGSGLGLLICKEFIELNHGSISMESVVEQGTTCSMFLPVGSLDGIEEKPVSYKSRFESVFTVREKAAPKTRILVVDDSNEIRLSMVEHLEYYFTVKSAVDGEQAWQILQNEMFDLVVSDVMMAGVDGFELCNRIRKNRQFESMGVVLITANTEEKNQIIGLNIGADAYLEKPFSMALLLSQVNAVLQRKRAANNALTIAMPDDSPLESTIEQETIDKINAILEANYPKAEFGIEQLADTMCMSRSQLYRKMRLWYGVTPIEYLQRYRLQKSTEYLKTGKYRMVDVASMAGFSCQQYFTTVFTKHFAVSPSEYMRMHRKQEG